MNYTLKKKEESMESLLKDPNYFYKVSMLHVRKNIFLKIIYHS